jgi:hypothetical protein
LKPEKIRFSGSGAGAGFKPEPENREKTRETGKSMILKKLNSEFILSFLFDQKHSLFANLRAIT